MGSRKDELTVSGVVSVKKENGNLTSKVIEYKTPRKVTPKVTTPSSFANSGVKNVSLIFSSKTSDYMMSFREMDYELSEKRISKSGKAFSLYFEIADEEAITYLEGNIVPLEAIKGALFLSINVSPNDPNHVDLFALPIIMNYSGSFLTVINDLSTVVTQLNTNISEKRKWIYDKMKLLLGSFPEVYKRNIEKLKIIDGMDLLYKVTLMDFNFTCCLENALSLTDCVLSVPDIEDICAECLVLPDCLAASFDFLTLPACLVCFSLDVLACAYCIYKAGECTEDASKVIECCS